ncbi:MAG: 3-dehydroquinate synthase [Spirochaetes bacterium]|nr:3-dehydroquinate synthase [Spirochaetota bacterium]MBN2770501.1 3-dehydroquinate synthase [Spirochaetota bacterium]
MSDIFRIDYKTSGKSSKVLVGESLSSLSDYITVKKSVIITDSNVYMYYKDQFPDCPVLVMECGEEHKTIDTVAQLHNELIELGCDRSSYIVGIGGGIVTDTAGFVASTFLRGVGFGFVSTTLLSQVDASVGGKNGVNHHGYKNMVGVFNQPDFVICDIEMLDTLPEKEYINGLGEVVKHALIADNNMYDLINDNIDLINERDKKILRQLIIRSIEIKTEVVTEDEREQGRRRILNFGHTLAHALEKCIKIDHGLAVAQGMQFAAQISCIRGLISREDVDSIKKMILSLNMNLDFSVDINLIKEAFFKDKKRESNDIFFVLLDAIGSAVVQKLTMAEVEEYVETLCCGK